MYYPQKGFAQLFVVLLILAGIGIGLYLVQHPQIFNPKAYDSSPADYSTEEFGSTPLSELYKYPKSPNNISIMGFFFLQQELEEPVAPGRPHGYGLTDEKAQFMAKEYDYLFINGLLNIRSDCNLPGPNSLKVDPSCYNHSNFFAKTAFLKSLNPKLKIGLPCCGGGVMNPMFLLFTYLNPTTDLLHKNGQLILNSPNHFYMNIGSPIVRQKAVNAFIDVFTKHPEFNGIFIDNYASSHNRAEFAAGCDEQTALPCNSLQFWQQGLTSFSSDLKNQLEAATHKPIDTAYNGIGYFSGHGKPVDSTINGEMNEGWIAQHTGALVEGFEPVYTGIPGNPPDPAHPAVSAATVLEDYLNTFKMVINGGKQIYILVQPLFIETRWPGYPYQNDLNLERYYLASFLLIQKPGQAYFGYHPGPHYVPYKIYFYRDWNLDFGLPNADFNKQSNGLFSRLYTSGIAVVNPTDQPLSFTLPGGAFRVWDDLNGQVSGTISIPAKTGQFLFNSALKSPSPVPSVSPSPVNQKPGDVDQDGDVDVFDYNLVLGNFGKTGTGIQGDFDNNGKVDIFDFNILITNFGK